MNRLDADTVAALRAAIQPARLLDTAKRLIAIASPTRSAGAAADELAEILAKDGFSVTRPAAGWSPSPAVVARYESGSPGKTLQFSGHLDTVHLPFVPPSVENGALKGSGASDMKGGIAAMVEGARVARQVGAINGGGILITAYDLHESPWGDGSQLDGLIDEGFVGDAVLIPEYLCDRLPLVGRGLAVLEVAIRREGTPVHEVLGGIDAPSVIYAGAELIRRLSDLDRRLAKKTHPMAGRESVFVGKVAAGEIFNQAPVEFRLAGTRRWLAGGARSDLEREFDAILADVAKETGTTIEGKFNFVRDAFELSPKDTFVATFQGVMAATCGAPLTLGGKPVVDDGNTFVARGKIPAITHGPNATGAHTTNESVPLAELERVALVYAAAAAEFCPSGK